MKEPKENVQISNEYEKTRLEKKKKVKLSEEGKKSLLGSFARFKKEFALYKK